MAKLTDVEQRALIDLANEARRRAYAPYSLYTVGAALRTASGRIFTGCNIENAASPSSICAERVAIFKAVSEGEMDLEVLALVTPNGGTPCGSCRQVMVEFNPDMLVLIADGEGRLLQETTVAGLLPGAFTKKDMMK
jgi:cytidine deaminase